MASGAHIGQDGQVYEGEIGVHVTAADDLCDDQAHAALQIEVEQAPRNVPLLDKSQGELSISSGPSSSLPSLPSEPRTRTLTAEMPLRPIEEVTRLAVEFASASRPPRMFEVMPRLGGKVRFRCGGRCVTGPANVDAKFNLCAWITIAAPSVFYFVFCSRDLWSWRDLWLLPVLTALILLVTILMLLLTSCTDPGIIPRHSMRLLLDGLEQEVAEAVGCVGISIDSEPVVCERLQSQGYRYCTYCKMIQPPRAKHCRDCDCCILRNDHHCPFVNNCIGQRNYVYFCGFLISVVCLGIFVFSGIGLWVSRLHGRGEHLSHSFRLILICGLGIPVGVLLLCVIVLGIFHMVLIYWGRTTREVLTGRRFGDGATLLGYRGHSLVHAREEVRFPPAEV